MNQNLTYTSYTDPRGSQQQQQQNQQMRDQLQGLAFHPSSYQSSTYTTPSTPFHSNTNANFLSNNGSILQSVQQQPRQQPRLSNVESEDKRIASMMETYFLDGPSGSGASWNTSAHTQNLQVTSQLQPQISYQNGTLIATTGPIKQSLQAVNKMMAVSPDKTEKERVKKARQAEAARMRYHRLTPEEKRDLNLKRTLAQKRKRQREKELEELDSILRETNDIQEDPDITEQLREKRMRAKWAEAARSRYARMTPEERRSHNNRRRMRQMQNALAAVKASSDYSVSALQAAGLGTGDPIKDEEAVRQHIKNQNAKKAEAARMRYHRMSEEEKRMYNQRRTEAFRRRRMEEEMLLAMPIGRINGEALDRAQQIVVRNAKRAEAARARYQRMTPDQRKNYNQKRYTPKRRGDSRLSGGGAGSSNDILTGHSIIGLQQQAKKEEMDALTSLERDVLKRTQQAQQALMRQGQQRAAAAAQQGGSDSSTPGPSAGSYIIQTPGGHLGGQQVRDVVHAHQISGQGHSLIQQGGFQQQGSLSSSQQQQQSSSGQPHLVVHHTAPPTSGSHLSGGGHHQGSSGHQVTYTANGVMINGQQQQSQQQVMNPYGNPPRN